MAKEKEAAKTAKPAPKKDTGVKKEAAKKDSAKKGSAPAGDSKKKAGHPDYFKSSVKCACGNVFETGSTKPEIHVDICAMCHPFYTGKQKFLDAAGRIERFNKKYNRPTKTAE